MKTTHRGRSLRGVRALSIASAIIAGALLAGCAADGTASDDGDVATDAVETENVRFTLSGSLVLATYPFISNAEAMGFFESNGVQVDVMTGQGSSQVLSLLTAGQTDMVFANPETLAQIVASGQNEDLISVYAVQYGQYRFMVPAGSEVTEISDLSGKRLGMFGPTSGIDYLNARFQDEGMDSSDVEIVSTGLGAQAMTAVQQGEVDALLYWQDAVNQFEYDGLEMVELPRAEWEEIELYSSTIITTRTFAEANPNTMVAVLRSFAQGQFTAILDPAKSVEAWGTLYPEQAATSDPEASFIRNVALLEAHNRDLPVDTAAVHDHVWGLQDESAWHTIVDNLERTGVLNGAVDPAVLISNEYTERANDFDRAAASAQVEAWSAE